MSRHTIEGTRNTSVGWTDEKKKRGPRYATKNCAGCGKEFPREEFLVGKARKHTRGRCRACQSEVNRVKDAKLASRFSQCRSQAKTRPYKWLLTFEEWAPLMAMPCHYCGLELNKYGRGLDRISRDGHYTADNVVPSCGVCNHLRSTIFTVEEGKLLGAVVREIKLARKAAGLPPLDTYEKKAGKSRLRKYAPVRETKQ